MRKLFFNVIFMNGLRNTLSSSSSPLSGISSRALLLAATIAGLLEKPIEAQEPMRDNVSVQVMDAMHIGCGKISAIPEIVNAPLPSDFLTYLQKTDIKKHPLRCIDGRPDSDHITNDLWPAMAGGATSAYAALLMCGDSISSVEVVKKLKDLGFIPGWHTDQSSVKDLSHGTGCGANDKLPTILDNFKQNSASLEPFMKALMGDKFDPKVYRKIVEATPLHVGHDPAILAERFRAQAANALQVLEAGHSGVHGHEESTITINYVPNTTLNGSRLQEKYDHNQTFDVDIWAFTELAHLLSDGDTEKEKELYHAFVAYQLSTAFTLTDGTQKIVILKEKIK